MSVSGKNKLLDPETDFMNQFLDPETFLKHQFLDPEADKKCQFLDGRPETDVMDQFLDPETDIMGEGNYIKYIVVKNTFYFVLGSNQFIIIKLDCLWICWEIAINPNKLVATKMKNLGLNSG